MLSINLELKVIKALGYRPTIKKVLHSLNVVEQSRNIKKKRTQNDN